MSYQGIEQLPKTDLLIQVPESGYVHPVSPQHFYKSPSFSAKCSAELVHTGKNYHNSLLAVPEGFRMSDLEEIAYLVQREAQLKAEGKRPRYALKDPLFKQFVSGKPYRCEWTARALRAPNGKENLGAYVKKDARGREYIHADLVRGEEIISEGIVVPKSRGGKIVKWNTALRIPAVVSEGKEPNHTAHHYLDTEAKEVAVVLLGGWRCGVRGKCLSFAAVYRRRDVYSDGAFRLFEGSLDEVPRAQTIDNAMLTDYEMGMADGEKLGFERAKKGFLQDLATLHEKYRL